MPMRILIVCLFVTCFFISEAQKRVYKNVDRVHIYDNGEIIYFKRKDGKPKIDTLFFDDKNWKGVTIRHAEDVSIHTGIKLKKK